MATINTMVTAKHWHKLPITSVPALVSATENVEYLFATEAPPSNLHGHFLAKNHAVVNNSTESDMYIKASHLQAMIIISETT